MNLASIVEGHPDDAVALVSEHGPTTYGELRDRIARVRGGLVELGVGTGDRVAIVHGNEPDFVVAYFAIVGLGAVAVPLDPESPEPERRRELAAVGPCASVIDGEPPMGEPTPPVDVAPDHVAALLFTSGTAGPPRAAMLSHGSLLANIGQSLTALDHTVAGDVVYGVLPLFHVFGLNVVLGVSMRVGATVVLARRFDPVAAARSIVRDLVTVLPGAPPMWIAFDALDELPADTFATVRLALSGAARLDPADAERFHERFGVEIREGYGLTEASPVVTSSVGMPWRPGSIGRVLGGIEVRLVDPDGADVPIGDAGEIWVRGDNVFLGYWNDPAASARVVHDGWLRTGDLAVADEDGFLYLVDRAKDLIIVSGFNVYPAEVEAVLLEYPGVVDAAVVGVADPHHGEAVQAYVVAAPGVRLDEQAIVAHAAEHLARYKCPSSVVVVDELPRHPTGKLIRRAL